MDYLINLQGVKCYGKGAKKPTPDCHYQALYPVADYFASHGNKLSS
jgi:hypothetical protein